MKNKYNYCHYSADDKRRVKLGIEWKKKKMLLCMIVLAAASLAYMDPVFEGTENAKIS